MAMDYRSSDSLSHRFSSRWSRVRNLIIYDPFRFVVKMVPDKDVAASDVGLDNVPPIKDELTVNDSCSLFGVSTQTTR
jgi:hypothetical protein